MALEQTLDVGISVETSENHVAICEPIGDFQKKTG